MFVRVWWCCCQTSLWLPWWQRVRWSNIDKCPSHCPSITLYLDLLVLPESSRRVQAARRVCDRLMGIPVFPVVSSLFKLQEVWLLFSLSGSSGRSSRSIRMASNTATMGNLPSGTAVCTTIPDILYIPELVWTFTVFLFDWLKRENYQVVATTLFNSAFMNKLNMIPPVAQI